jgi:hypothetical protein
VRVKGTAAHHEKQLENGLSPLYLHTNPRRERQGTISGHFPRIDTPPRNAVFEAQIGFQHGAFETDRVTFVVIAHRLVLNQNDRSVLKSTKGTRGD